jgi:hypothetical protein
MCAMLISGAECSSSLVVPGRVSTGSIRSLMEDPTSKVGPRQGRNVFADWIADQAGPLCAKPPICQ